LKGLLRKAKGGGDSEHGAQQLYAGGKERFYADILVNRIPRGRSLFDGANERPASLAFTTCRPVYEAAVRTFNAVHYLFLQAVGLNGPRKWGCSRGGQECLACYDYKRQLNG
jgi:hypothetical protein